MNKKSSLINFKDYEDKSKYRIKTGVFILDFLLGGGLPLWKYSLLWGKESSGKTTLALRTAGNFSKMYPDRKIIYMDIEKTFDKQWASIFIKNTNNLFISQPDYGEEAVDVAVEEFKKPDVGLLIVDSLAEMVSIADADKSALEDTMGSLSKLVNKLLRKTLPILGFKEKEKQPAMIILLNQLTTNFNARGFQSPYKKPAGLFQNFIATIDIQNYTKDYKESKGIKIEVIHQFTINKAKITGAYPKASGEYRMALVDHDGYKKGDVIDEELIVAYGRKTKLITQEGKTWKILDKKFNTLSDIIEFLKNDKNFKEILYDEIIKVGAKFIFEEEE